MSEEYKEYEAVAGDSGDEPKKKTSPWMWVAIGCGGLVVLVVLVFVLLAGLGLFMAKDVLEEYGDNPARAMAEIAIRQDPNLEILGSDETSFTIRDRSTGEETTIDFEDISEGKLTISTEEGEVRIEAHGEEDTGGITVSGPEGEMRIGADASAADVPSWVPLYPDAAETTGNFHMASDEGVNGVVSQITKDDLEKVLEWFKKWLEDRDFESGGQTISTSGEGAFAVLSAEHAGEGRTVNITMAETEEGTTVTVNYSEGG